MSAVILSFIPDSCCVKCHKKAGRSPDDVQNKVQYSQLKAEHGARGADVVTLLACAILVALSMAGIIALPAAASYALMGLGGAIVALYLLRLCCLGVKKLKDCLPSSQANIS